MSGEDVPYQLRPRKYIDRQVFFDALGFVDRFAPLTSYAYVSLGGRFLDDFGAVHSRFGIEKLVSIEESSWVHQRQKFNLPVALIEARQQTIDEFIQDFDVFDQDLQGKGLIIWLDYTRPSERQLQLRELQDLISRLDLNDVFKITINASPTTLDSDPYSEKGAAEKQQKRLDFLREKLGDYLPGELATVDNMTHKNLPRVLAGAVSIAVTNGLRAHQRRTALPLAVLSYRDSGSHTMLTAAGIILKSTDVHRFDSTTGFCDWELKPDGWTDVREIVVPDLSVKERYRIAEGLFVQTVTELHDSLPFRFAAKDEESLGMLRDYVLHYRRYPSFMRVDL